ncbi:PP2C family protein-serine/threonine phosphatase [Streptomyces sp. NPDC059740]|uniref:PP2C family protein-serine/threonine phosphatase n=1 Tax=Streptomyces sp. NPDC059740 TaxID=3346926 RepID=UPI003654A28D
MDRTWRRLSRVIPWVPPLLLLAAVATDALTPEPYTGAPLASLAAMTAAAALSFRYTAWTAAIGVTLAVASGVLQRDSAEYDATLLANVVLAALLALAINRLLARQSARLTLERGRLASAQDRLSLAHGALESLQRAIIPVPPTTVGALRLACRYEAASAEAQIGGDLYAVRRAPGGGLRFLVADVRGKGLSAVAAVSVLTGAFRERAGTEEELVAVARRLDEAVVRNITEDVGAGSPAFDEGFATALVGEVDRDCTTLRLVDCGHPPPYLAHGGRLTELSAAEPGVPLGLGALSPDGPRVEAFSVPPGGVLLCVTDGVTEARDDHGVFYDPLARLHPPAQVAPADLIDLLFRSVHDWTGEVRDDDMAVLALAGPAVRGTTGTAGATADAGR